MWKNIFKFYKKVSGPLKGFEPLDILYYFFRRKWWEEKYNFEENSSCSCELWGRKVKMGKREDFLPLLVQGIVNEKIFHRDVEDFKIVIDIGAFVGGFTIYSAMKLGQKGKVIAFEPVSKNFQRLKRNIKLNNLENVLLKRKAIWRKSSSSIDINCLGGNSTPFDVDEIWPRPNYRKRNKLKTETVQTSTLDEIFERYNISENAFVKIDAMGSEVNILRGAENVLKEKNPYFSIAGYYRKNKEKNLKRIITLFRKYDYKFKVKTPLGREMMYAWKKDP